MKNSSTGYTPFYLLYGHEPILPLEFSLTTSQLARSQKPITTSDTQQHIVEWVKFLSTQLEDAQVQA